MKTNGPLQRLAWALCLAMPLLTHAEDSAPVDPVTLVKVDDFAVTNLHLALFANQTGRSPEDAEGQIRLLNELVNSVMIARSAAGRALAGQPEVVAALEVASARLIAQTFVRDQLDRIQLSDEQVRAYYDQRYSGETGTEYKARHILLAEKEQAEDVIRQLRDGADFAELAGTRSIGPSKAVGGDLGWFEPDQMVPEFASATAAVADGAFSEEPVQTQFGWHVILREQSRAVQPPAYDTVKAELETELRQRQIAEAIAAIREEVSVEVQDIQQ
ncbi:MAG: peptidylprolyl isomerase [Gammaproteobacteria bacterium]|nr:peptidylprolyl isomerase [Gammaproteobacteria bacterium]